MKLHLTDHLIHKFPRQKRNLQQRGKLQQSLSQKPRRLTAAATEGKSKQARARVIMQQMLQDARPEIKI